MFPFGEDCSQPKKPREVENYNFDPAFAEFRAANKHGMVFSNRRYSVRSDASSTASSVRSGTVGSADFPPRKSLIDTFVDRNEEYWVRKRFYCKSITVKSFQIRS